MWAISPTISQNQLFIIAYSTSGCRTSTTYQVPVDAITSTATTSDQSVNWKRLPDAPHYSTALLPHSYPPVIIGGYDIQYVPTSDVAILDMTKKTWIRVASLSTARSCVAVVPSAMSQSESLEAPRVVKELKLMKLPVLLQ